MKTSSYIFSNQIKYSQIKYFLKSNFLGVNRFFVLVYANVDDNAKTYKDKRYLPKGVIKNYNVIINGKSFYDHRIDSDIKRYEEIKLTTG